MCDENESLPQASHCEYLEEKEIRPWLSGCPNNDSCPSWFGNLFWGYGDAANEGPEIRQFRDLVAQEKHDEWKENFARKYFEKKPILSRQEPDGFWHMISQDSLSAVESVERSSSAFSTSGGETAREALEAAMHFGDQQDTMGKIAKVSDESNVKDTATPESPDIDPEDLFYGNVIETSSDEDVKSNSDETERTPPRAKSIGEGRQNPVAPVWNCFYPVMDMGRDGDFLG
jgi:hypothetical protein